MSNEHFKYCHNCFLKKANAHLLESTKAALLKNRTSRAVGQDRCILSQGSIPAYLYCVGGGKINAVEMDLNGNSSLIFSFTNDVLFPLFSLFNENPTKYEYTTAEPSRLCQFPIKVIKELLVRDMDLAKLLLESACRQGLEAYERINILQGKTASEKVLRALNQFKNTENICKISRKEIALWTNLTVETVIRTLTSLEKKQQIKKTAKGVLICHK